METVNILDARNRLSQLIAEAGGGAEVVIAKRGKPVVRLVAIEGQPSFTAGAAAAWLVRNHVPTEARSLQELNAQIEREREGWE